MAEHPKPNRLLQGTLILTVAGMVVKVIGSLNWIILSRVLGGEGIGLYQMAFPIYLLALSVSSAGIPVAISIITAEKVALKDYSGSKRVFKLSMGILAVTGLLLSLLVYFGAGWLIGHQIIRDSRAYYAIQALSPAIFLVTILSSFRGYLQGWQIMTPTAVSQIAEQIFRVGAMLFFAMLLLPRGIEYAAGGASMGAGAGAAAGLLVLLYYYWRLEKQQNDFADSAVAAEKNHEPVISMVRRIVKLALPVSLASIMLPLVANLDLLIVPLRLEAAGYTVEQATELFGYLTGMAVPLVNLATMATAALATSIVPAVSEAAVTGNMREIQQRTATAMRFANLVTIPAAVGLWVLAEPIATFVYHAPQASQVVRVLSFGVYLLGIHQVTTGVLQGMGHAVLPVINMGVAAVIKVVFNYYLTAVPSLGISGAGWATNADLGVAALLNYYFVCRYTGFQMDRKTLGKYLLAAAIMGICIDFLHLVTIKQGIGDAEATLLLIILAMLIYTISVILLGAVNEQELKRIPVVGAVLHRLFWRFGLNKN
ncbi:polysaccharide biosynthesis C-terminal domain-containing protein [Sporomusa aerivorans]|uniref:putative polysaccharide biosynthesis protein n=1 Tax=Sporomusa aerivorans TaxID=204936 RepID=UPI00352A3A8A